MSQNQNGVLSAGDNFGIRRSFMGLHKGDHCGKKKTTNVLGFFFNYSGKDTLTHEQVKCATMAIWTLPIGYLEECCTWVLSRALEKEHLEADTFLGLTRSLVSVMVSGECRWDQAARWALVVSQSSIRGFVLCQSCWQRGQSWSPGGFCCAFIASQVLCWVVFWPSTQPML